MGPNCNEKLITIPNTGAGTSYGDELRNQCLWISITDFLNEENKFYGRDSIKLEHIITEAGVNHMPNTMFDDANLDFNIGSPPLWACPSCTHEGYPIVPFIAGIDSITCSCTNCNDPNELGFIYSYPLQRLANLYNLRIQIYKVFRVRNTKYAVLDHRIIIQDPPHKGFITIQPIAGNANHPNMRVIHIAQFPNHFELIVNGCGIQVPFHWKEKIAQIKQEEEDKLLALSLVGKSPSPAQSPSSD